MDQVGDENCMYAFSVIVPYIGGVTMEKNWRRKGVNILLLSFLMAVSILAVSCNSHDTQVTNSETQQETDKTENPSEFLEYKEVLHCIIHNMLRISGLARNPQILKN